MNHPLDRLRALAGAHHPDGLPDVDALARRAAVLRWQRGGATGTALACVVALAVAFSGSGPQRLGVTAPPSPSYDATPEPTTSPGAEATPVESPGGGDPAETPDPAFESADPEPESTPSEAPAPTASSEPSLPAVGPVPYYDERYEAGRAPKKCPTDTSDKSIASGTITAKTPVKLCWVEFLAFDDERALVTTSSLCLLAPDQHTFVYQTEQEVELTISEHDPDAASQPDPVYTWSQHRSFAPTPHQESVHIHDCITYVWHLAAADDAGRPLVPGREYVLEVRSKDAEIAGYSARVVFTMP